MCIEQILIFIGVLILPIIIPYLVGKYSPIDLFEEFHNGKTKVHIWFNGLIQLFTIACIIPVIYGIWGLFVKLYHYCGTFC